jgi:hypothetical protein
MHRQFKEQLRWCCPQAYKAGISDQVDGSIDLGETRREGRSKVKPIKMFGLAALAALMAMAFVGASSAMASGNTALCTADEDPCNGPGTVITHVHESSVGKASILGSPLIKCNVLFLGDALNSGLANPLTIHGAFTYTSCTNFCHVLEQNGPARIVFLRTGAELANVAPIEFLIHVTCPFGINCYYDGEGLEGHGLGALTSTPNGSIVIFEQLLTEEFVSEICPEEGALDITTAPLIATYISS